MIGPYLVVDLSGGFRLHLLVFPFVYLFHSRIEASLDSRMELVHHLQMTTSEGFQHHFNIISKFVSDLELIQTNKGGSFFQSQEVWQQSLVHISSQNFKIIRSLYGL